MEQTLAYLRETLSNHIDNHSVAKQVYEKLVKHSFKDELEFVRALDEDESQFLNKMLPDEISYAMEEKDYTRMNELNNVYERLI